MLFRAFYTLWALACRAIPYSIVNWRERLVYDNINHNKETKMNSIKKTARIAGFLYLVYIVISIFADVLVL
jgi:hypothetical protein